MSILNFVSARLPIPPSNAIYRRCLQSFFCIFCVFSTTQAIAQRVLPAAIDASLIKANIRPDALSVTILRADQSLPFVSQSAERSMSPASSMKLLTTLVALDELGPSFRWKTRFLSEQAVERGVLRGPLYLRGGGDPNLTWDKLALLLRNLRNQGIRKIAGDIILDRTYFHPSRPDLGAPLFDESPAAYYNVIPDALLIHSNLISLALDATTDTIRVQLATPLADIKLINHLTFNDLPCKEWDKASLKPSLEINRRRSIELLLTGSFPKRCQATAHLNLLDRNLYIESTLRALWTEMGGRWQGHTRDGETPANATLLAERESETLAEIIRLTNKFSDNSMARGLYLSLGAEALAKQSADQNQSAFTPSTAAAGEARIRQWLARHQIADQGIVFDNGSGLSRTERLSTAQLAQILQVALHDPWYPEFASSFPIAALDGTMRKRLKASAAEQRARIKTGTLKNALAIAGYVRDLNNIDWIVVAFINDEAAPQGKDALDNLIAWLASGELSTSDNVNHHSSDAANQSRQ